MTVLERLKAAGYDPAKSIYPDSIGSNAGSLECGRVLIHTSFCRPAPFTDAIRVKATAFTGFSDGSERPYPDGWPNSVRANVVLFFDVGVDFRSLGRIETSFSDSDNELRYRVLSRCILLEQLLDDVVELAAPHCIRTRLRALNIPHFIFGRNLRVDLVARADAERNVVQRELCELGAVRAAERPNRVVDALGVGVTSAAGNKDGRHELCLVRDCFSLLDLKHCHVVRIDGYHAVLRKNHHNHFLHVWFLWQSRQ